MPDVEIVRVVKQGASHYIVIPPKFMAALRLNRGDRVAYRYAEGKLILERVNIESMAKVSAGVIDAE